jgi:hypothetical protein
MTLKNKTKKNKHTERQKSLKRKEKKNQKGYNLNTFFFSPRPPNFILISLLLFLKTKLTKIKSQKVPVLLYFSKITGRNHIKGSES